MTERRTNQIDPPKTSRRCGYVTAAGVFVAGAFLCAYCGGWHASLRPQRTK